MQKTKLKEDEQALLFNKSLGAKTDKETLKNILEGLKEFREKHWDDSLPIDKAYKKYMKLAEPFLHELP